MQTGKGREGTAERKKVGGGGGGGEQLPQSTHRVGLLLSRTPLTFSNNLMLTDEFYALFGKTRKRASQELTLQKNISLCHEKTSAAFAQNTL